MKKCKYPILHRTTEKLTFHKFIGDDSVKQNHFINKHCATVRMANDSSWNLDTVLAKLNQLVKN